MWKFWVLMHPKLNAQLKNQNDKNTITEIKKQSRVNFINNNALQLISYFYFAVTVCVHFQISFKLADSFYAVHNEL